MMCKMKAMFDTRRYLLKMWSDSNRNTVIFPCLKIEKPVNHEYEYHNMIMFPPNRMEGVATEQSLGKGWPLWAKGCLQKISSELEPAAASSSWNSSFSVHWLQNFMNWIERVALTHEKRFNKSWLWISFSPDAPLMKELRAFFNSGK